MPPQRGIGGNHAWQDARVLAARLVGAVEEGPIDWPRLLLGYERELFRRGRAAVEESMEMADLCHLESRLAAALRNGVLRAVDKLAAAKHAFIKRASSAENKLGFPRLS
jgi:2-polyprenyl-6-methoxyphenol hydroxylase-like FAD-dependent oxidoreductase